MRSWKLKKNIFLLTFYIQNLLGGDFRNRIFSRTAQTLLVVHVTQIFEVDFWACLRQLSISDFPDEFFHRRICRNHVTFGWETFFSINIFGFKGQLNFSGSWKILVIFLYKLYIIYFYRIYIRGGFGMSLWSRKKSFFGIPIPKSRNWCFSPRRRNLEKFLIAGIFCEQNLGNIL